MNKIILIIVFIDNSVLSEEIETNTKAPKCKAGDRARFTKYKNIFRKGYTKRGPKEILFIDFVLKTNP